VTDVARFDFDLPPELIAQEARPRGASRLMIVDRPTQSWRESVLQELPELLAPGDLIVANDTRVFPARLLGTRLPGGGAAECLLLTRVDEHHWEALVHPGQRLRPGSRMQFADPSRAPGVTIHAEIIERRHFGRRLVRFDIEGAATLDQAVDAVGHVPLPPYIDRPDTAADAERYQTIYATHRGSIAAPTAGLHFDPALIEALRARGIGWATVTLHVGYGTFKPVRAESIEAHQVDAERAIVPAATADAIRRTRSAGKRVVAIGTTTTRALETAAASGDVHAFDGATDLFIHPGHTFRAVDALVTNFHLPRSSLLMLVAAFAGLDLTLAAYRDAVAKGFRFYSYGDAMVVL